MADSGADFEQQLRDANEQLYKHSLELAVRNKTLSLLRQLYQISIQSLARQELGEQITNTVREALDFELVAVMRYDAVSDMLEPLAISRSARLAEATAEADHPFRSTVIPQASTLPLLEKVYAGESVHTGTVTDLWGTVIPAERLATISASGHIKALSVHPLMIDRKLTGALVFGMNRPFESLSAYEHDSIESLVDVTAIALDRARLYEELREANERQVVLIHFITHQIKGFVTKSRNIFATLLEGDYGAIADTMKPLLEEGLRSDTKGVETIQEILNASNIKSGKVTYAKTPLDFKDLAEDMVEYLKPNADEKGLTLAFSAPEGDYHISGDRMQLVNAVKNLVDNSIKYTLKGRIDVSLTRQDGVVRLTVADTGVGITPEDMKVLFTEGGHGKESTKINVESTGFGLYIVKNIIQAHGGKVWAESEGEGKGARFIAELPVS